MMHWARMLAGLTIALVVLGNAAVADGPRRTALLVGVTGYSDPMLAALPALEGPQNDVALMHRVLRRNWQDRGRIIVLADRIAPAEGLSADGLPTRSAILGALADIASGARPGDEVLIYLSGHGLQLDDDGGDEVDGLDEAFLPLDARLSTAEAEDGTDRPAGLVVSNALEDDRIGRAVAQITARGAFVWLIADTCHAATLQRAGGGLTARSVALLAPDGGPIRAAPERDPLADDALTSAPDLRRLPPGAGFVGFFAASASEPAFEGPVPPGAETGRVHGLLTWALAHALGSRPVDNYQTLARAVSARLGRAAHPVFSGDLRRAGMLGQAARPAWPLIAEPAPASASPPGVALAAGALDGVDAGMVVAVHDAGDATAAAPLFHATVHSVDLARSGLMPLAGPENRLDATIAAEGLPPERFRARWLADRAPRLEARPLSVAPNLEIRIAVPQALRAMMPPTTVRLVAPGTPADATVLDLGAGFEIVSATGAALGQGALGDPARLATAVQSAARTLRLRRILGRFADTGPAADLRAEVYLRAGPPAAAPCPPPPTREPAFRTDDTPPDLSPARGEVRHCDTVFVVLTNLGAGTLDLTALYLDPDGRAWFLDGYRGGTVEGLRLASGQTRVISYVEDLSGQDSPAGRIELAVIAVPGQPGSPPRDFRGLASGASGSAVAALRGAASPAGVDAFARLLAPLAEATMRSGTSATATPLTAGGVRLIALTTRRAAARPDLSDHQSLTESER